MKKTDVVMIILIASVSIMAAFFIAQKFLGPQTDTVKVKTIEKVNDELVEPSNKIFNSDSINPSVEVQIKPSDQQ